MSLDMELGRGPGDFVLHGDPTPLQTARWMKMVLGMEVGLSPGDFVLDRDPVSFPQKGRSPPPQIFGPFVLWRNGCMHQDATWYGACLLYTSPSPRDFVLDGDPAPSLQQGAVLPPNFRPMFIVAKRLDGSKCYLAWR